MAAISGNLVTALSAKGRNLIKLSKSLTIEQQQHLLVGRLIDNVERGTDKGVMSAKVLGSRKEISLWTPDLQVGVVLVNAPESSVKTLQVPDEEKK